MFKGYRNHLFYKDRTNKNINSFPYISKCSKCNNLNPVAHSPAAINMQLCMYCGNPFYIIKSGN